MYACSTTIAKGSATGPTTNTWAGRGGHTRRYLKHRRVPKPERHYAQPLWHEPRVLHGQGNAREVAAQLEQEDAKGKIDGFVFDIAAQELTRVRNATIDKRKQGTRRTTNVANQLSLACPASRVHQFPYIVCQFLTLCHFLPRVYKGL